MDTPLTDALFAEMQARDDGYDPDLEMMRDLARRLERDRTMLLSALERAEGCINGLLARRPVRDVAETKAEISAAIKKVTGEG